MFDTERLEELWTPRLRAAGSEAYALLSPHLEEIIRKVYVHLLKVEAHQVTEDQIKRGFLKFEKILVGDFSPVYMETQRKTAQLLIEQGVDFITYLAIYAIYHRECAIRLAQHMVEGNKVRDEMFGCLHLALQCDATVSMDGYFDAMDAANAARATEVTALKNKRIMEVSTSIGNFSTQTKMLAINAAIEASRAGDAGKGFAVVATEIKAMASKVQDATDQISNLASG